MSYQITESITYDINIPLMLASHAGVFSVSRTFFAAVASKTGDADSF